jgi:hypothetical protein
MDKYKYDTDKAACIRIPCVKGEFELYNDLTKEKSCESTCDATKGFLIETTNDPYELCACSTDT